MQQQQQKRSFLMTLIDLFLHLSWQLLDTAFPKQKKCLQQLLLLQVFCVKLILRSKLQISDLKISEHSWIWNDFAKTYEQFHWWCDSFLHSRAVSPIKYQHRVDHLFILLFFSSFLLWLIASFELIDLSYQLPKFFPWHTTITLKHFDQKNPNSSPGVLCQVDVCLMVLGDCFKIAFYIYFTRKIMTGHFKKPFFLPWMGCWTTKHYGYIL